MRQCIKLREDERKERRQALVDGARVLAPQSAYRPEFVELARMCCLAFGAIDAQLAAFFHINPTTLDQWKQRYPEFREACKEGKMPADAKVVASLYKRAVGFRETIQELHTDKDGHTRVIEIEKFYPPDTTACIYWTKNRLPADWRDRPDVQVNIAAGIKIESLSDSQLEHLIQRLTDQING